MRDATQYELWPFLIGTGKYLPHQLIVAPRFLYEARSAGLLATATSVRDEQTPSGQAYLRVIIAPEGDARNISVIFRTLVAKQAFVGGGNNTLTDDARRAIVLCEGVVARGHLTNPVITQHSLDAAHEHVLTAFRQFWESRSRFETIPSDPLPLSTSSQGDSRVHIVSLHPYTIGASPPDIALPDADDTPLSFFGHSFPLHIADAANARLAPENTIEACALAVAQGADALAIDIEMTRDGEIVATLDPLERTTNGKGRAADHTLAELRTLDAGYMFTPDKGKTYPWRGRGATIPTLRMIYQRFPAHLIVINLSMYDKRIPPYLWQIIREQSAEHRTLVTCRSRKLLRQFRHVESGSVATAASPKELWRWLRAMKWHVLWLFRPQYDVISIPIYYYQKRLSPAVFSVAHRTGLHVYLIEEDAADMRRSIHWQINGIITNRPDLLEPVLRHLPGDLDRIMRHLRALRAFGQHEDALALARTITARQDAPSQAFLARAQLAEEAGLQDEAKTSAKTAEQLLASTKQASGRI